MILSVCKTGMACCIMRLASRYPLRYAVLKITYFRNQIKTQHCPIHKIQRSRTGDCTVTGASRFSYLYDHYARALNRVIARMVDDPALAEDILQKHSWKYGIFFQLWCCKGSAVYLDGEYYLEPDWHAPGKGYKKQQKISGDENSVTGICRQSSKRSLMP